MTDVDYVRLHHRYCIRSIFHCYKSKWSYPFTYRSASKHPDICFGKWIGLLKVNFEVSVLKVEGVARKVVDSVANDV